MLTSFGKELRKIRIDHGETLKDMSVVLNVSAAFLSSVETGKKNIPSGWVEAIAAHYSLTGDEYDSLSTAAKDSVKSVKIDLTGAVMPKRSAALIFARNFENVSEDTAKKIIEMLDAELAENPRNKGEQ